MSELGDGLTLAALVAATLEYAILMRHRAVRRYELLMDASIAEAGLRGLVRVVLIEDPRRSGRRHSATLRSTTVFRRLSTGPPSAAPARSRPAPSRGRRG